MAPGGTNAGQRVRMMRGKKEKKKKGARPVFEVVWHQADREVLLCD